MNSLYQKGKTIKSLYQYFSPYFSCLSQPTAAKYFLVVLAFIVLQHFQSVQFAYDWFMSHVTDSSLNSFYHFFSYSSLDLSALERVTLAIARSCQPEEFQSLPVYLLIDDTLQSKFGSHFENVGLLHDHAQHNGSNWLKGHSFVALSLTLPMARKKDGTLECVTLPLAYRQYERGESKLATAASLVEAAIEQLDTCPQLILLCDSWYTKGAVINVVKKYPTLELVASARIDTALFEVPIRTGKRGRPAIKGTKLSVKEAITLTSYGEAYKLGVRQVRTNLFGAQTVWAYLTKTGTDTYRLFLSTIDATTCLFKADELTDTLYHKVELTSEQKSEVLPLVLYQTRWQIETQFYLQKTFWSFGSYRIRSRKGVETYLHLLSSAYTCLLLLPYQSCYFSSLTDLGPQQRKQVLGQQIRDELFLCRFADSIETPLIKRVILKALASLTPFSKVG